MLNWKHLFIKSISFFIKLRKNNAYICRKLLVSSIDYAHKKWLQTIASVFLTLVHTYIIISSNLLVIITYMVKLETFLVRFQLQLQQMFVIIIFTLLKP